MGYIYKLTLLKDTKTYKKGEIYIGQTNGNNPNYYTSGKIPINIIKKYGKEIFNREIIHDNINREDLDKWEMYYIGFYDACRICGNKKTNLNLNLGGLNIRNDDISGENNPNYNNLWSKEQKERMSFLKKEYYKYNKVNYKTKEKISKKSKILWQNEEKKIKMAKSVSLAKTNYNICQFDKEMNLIEIYQTMPELLKRNPFFKKMPIYSTCNGWKKSYKGFIWKYQDKLTGKIIEKKR